MEKINHFSHYFVQMPGTCLLTCPLVMKVWLGTAAQISLSLERRSYPLFKWCWEWSLGASTTITQCRVKSSVIIVLLEKLLVGQRIQKLRNIWLFSKTALGELEWILLNSTSDHLTFLYPSPCKWTWLCILQLQRCREHSYPFFAPGPFPSQFIKFHCCLLASSASENTPTPRF